MNTFDTYVYIRRNGFENTVCEIASILTRCFQCIQYVMCESDTEGPDVLLSLNKTNADAEEPSVALDLWIVT